MSPPNGIRDAIARAASGHWQKTTRRVVRWLVSANDAFNLSPKQPMRLFSTAAAAVGLLSFAALSAPVGAQELVTNGGFETGSFSGWTVGGCRDYTGVYPGGHSGSYYGSFGATGSCYTTLSQTLNTVAGQQYAISFFGFNEAFGDGSNGVRVFFDGTNVFDQALTNGSFQQFTATGTASSNSTVFTFEAFNNPSYNEIDDISVVASGVTTTPEPSSMALLGTGLVGLVPMIRRCRR